MDQIVKTLVAAAMVGLLSLSFQSEAALSSYNFSGQISIVVEEYEASPVLNGIIAIDDEFGGTLSYDPDSLDENDAPYGPDIPLEFITFSSLVQLDLCGLCRRLGSALSLRVRAEPGVRMGRPDRRFSTIAALD